MKACARFGDAEAGVFFCTAQKRRDVYVRANKSAPVVISATALDRFSVLNTRQPNVR
jgi:hypothetical protein